MLAPMAETGLMSCLMKNELIWFISSFGNVMFCFDLYVCGIGARHQNLHVLQLADFFL